MIWFTLSDRQIVRFMQQGNGPVDIFRYSNIEADPTALRQNVMWVGPPLCNDLVAYLGWKGDIDQGIAVDVADLAPLDPVFGPAKTMGACGNHLSRFSDLKEAIPGLSARVLSERLKQLEADGVLTRTGVSGITVRVEYRLTAKGLALRKVMIALYQWGMEWHPVIEEKK